MQAQQRLYLNEAGDKVVPEGDAAAATLWKAEGDDITSEEVRQYNLGRELAADKADEKAEDAKASETKAVDEAPANKGRSGQAERR